MEHIYGKADSRLSESKLSWKLKPHDRVYKISGYVPNRNHINLWEILIYYSDNGRLVSVTNLMHNLFIL